MLTEPRYVTETVTTTKEDGIVIELNNDEMIALGIIVGNIGGDMDHPLRVVAHELYEAIGKKYPDLHRHPLNKEISRCMMVK